MSLTTVTLPQHLPFPVTVTSVACRAGDTIPKHEAMLTYKYWDYQEDPRGDEGDAPRVRVERVGTFESPVGGEVAEVLVCVGQELAHAAAVATVREPCDHSVQYGGLCALCGRAVDDKDYSGYDYEERASIEMSHDSTGLKISYDEAAKIEQSTTARLVEERKLILVVDLDQTVIHATVDPTVGEWQRDPTNPNYASVKDVRSFCLEEVPIMPPGWTGPRYPPTKCWYYVKLRPGLEEFLRTVSQLYELHIYTMATRNYALAIAKIIDPTAAYFGDRILSRDESGSLTHKNLKRLFPVDQSMVAIIDDRGDVWQWESNLIKVVPYDFFVGIGDINSSFLPKKNGQLTGPTKRRKSIAQLEEMEAKPAESAEPAEPVEPMEESAAAAASPVERILELGGGEDNANLLLEQSLTRNLSIEQQQHDRPLAKLQHDLEMIQHDEESDSETEGGDAPAREEHLLYDDDTELAALERALQTIHAKYYEIHQQHEAGKISLKPDLTSIIPSLKHRCLEGVTVLFSGILPLGVNLERSDIVIWCKQFGVRVVSEVLPEVTHVVCRDNKSKFKVGPTFKVRAARKLLPHVKIVNPDWLFACLSSWSKVDEDEYLIESSAEDWYISDRDLQKYKEVLAQQQEQRDEQMRRDSVNAVDYSLDGVEQEVDEFLAGISDDDYGEHDDDDDDDDDDDEQDTGVGSPSGAIDADAEAEAQEFAAEEAKKGVLKRSHADSSGSDKRRKVDEVDLDELEQELLDGFDELEE
ncbi:RNA polymerase II subunit A C-terminal domain phosphatase [[Candida] zeylanoides]